MRAQCGLTGTGADNFVCWGDNAFGQRAPPGSLPQLSAIVAGARHTCGVTAAAKQAVCFGSNRCVRVRVCLWRACAELLLVLQRN